MKPTMAIKPLVFAIAAVMAVAVQAGQNDDWGHKHHRDHTPPPKQIDVQATAKATDTQNSTNNYILNQGTKDSATMSNSGTGSSGNVGINVAGGDGNQQDNAAAIANAGSMSTLDNSFVFGNATSTASVKQTSKNNQVDNYGSSATALMSGSASGTSGNIGINVASGDLNQQKNTMAIANSNAKLGSAMATASADQSSPGLTVNNNADRTYRVDTLTDTTTTKGHQSASGSFDVNGKQSQSSSWGAKGSSSFDASASQKASFNASVDASLKAKVAGSESSSWSNGHHHGSQMASGKASVDASLNASIDAKESSSSKVSLSSSYAKSASEMSKSSFDKSGSFKEASSFDLSNSCSYQVLTPTGWANPVTNTATLSGSVIGGSGNLGVNVAAGVGNQQSNSLAISNTSM